MKERTRGSYVIAGQEVVAEGADLRVNILTLTSGQCIPWHSHSETADTFFCMEGSLTVEVRAPAASFVLKPGERCTIGPKRPHHVHGNNYEPCKFMIVQGVGVYDWMPEHTEQLLLQARPVPGTGNFLDALRPYTVIADPVSLTQDFTHLKSFSREDQLRELRELADRGQTITAVYAARKLYGCSLGEAKDMVASLRENEARMQPLSNVLILLAKVHEVLSEEILDPVNLAVVPELLELTENTALVFPQPRSSRIARATGASLRTGKYALFAQAGRLGFPFSGREKLATKSETKI